MSFLEWVGSVVSGMGWKAWVLGGLLLLILLAVPGVWVVQSVGGLFGGVDRVSFEEQGEEVMVDGVRYASPDLTREADILREAFAHDATLIASIPTPTPTIDPGATLIGPGGTAVMALLAENPGGVPITGSNEGLRWFEADRGLYFHRERGGDWTAPEVREESAYRSLVEYTGYPEGVSNFADGSLVYDLAVKLAFAMVDVRPAFGTPTAAMIASLSRDMGWEFMDVPDLPAIRLWTSFKFQASDLSEYEYAVGGVMLLRVGELEDGSQYLLAGSFVEPGVVLERLGESR